MTSTLDSCQFLLCLNPTSPNLFSFVFHVFGLWKIRICITFTPIAKHYSIALICMDLFCFPLKCYIFRSHCTNPWNPQNKPNVYSIALQFRPLNLSSFIQMQNTLSQGECLDLQYGDLLSFFHCPSSKTHGLRGVFISTHENDDMWATKPLNEWV